MADVGMVQPQTQMVPAGQGVGGPTPETQRQFEERLGAMVASIRDRRKPQEERDLDAHAVWFGDARQHAYKSDTFNYRIPVARRAIERFVVRATQSLFSTLPPFEVYPGNEYDDAQGREADAVRIYLTYLMEKRLKIRKQVTKVMRCMAMYHRAIVCNTVMVEDFGGGAPPMVWPTTKVVDPFSFYVWPETADDISEALLVFEDIMMPWGRYQQAVSAGIAAPINPDELMAPEWPAHLTQRLSRAGMSTPSDTGEGTGRGRGLGKYVALSECYFKSGLQWMRCWLVWNVVNAPRLVRAHPSRYPRPPYHWAIARPLVGEQYSTGMMDDLVGLQALFDDQINQTEEARTIAGLPPVAIDTSMVNRTDQLIYGPRRKWFVPEPDKSVRTVNVPDTSIASARAAQMTLALLNSIGGNNPATEGQPTRGLPRAGGAVMSLLALAMADTKEVALIVEDELLTPTLADLHRLTLEFVPHEQVIRIPGTEAYPPQVLRPEDLYGDWNLRWVGPNHAEELKARGQALGQFALGLGKIAPILQQQGYMVRWDRIMKRIWRDSLGERGAEDIIVPIQEGMGPEGMGPQELATIMQMLQAGGGGVA